MKREKYGYPVLTSEQTRAMDAAVEGRYGLPLAVLMENAGRAMADAVTRRGVKRVFFVAGPGNNGGDAMVAGRILLARGVKVGALLSKDVKELSGLPALQARRFVEAGGSILPWVGALVTSADLIVDGLLGTGLAEPPHGRIAEIIEKINTSGVPVLSVDVPSGVLSDSGAEPECAVQATETVTFGAYKPALVHYPAAGWAGEVTLADIGQPDGLYPPADAQVLSAGYAQNILPQWRGDTHKGKRGSLLIVAGSRGMTGAAAMAAQSAVHAGTGLVYLSCPETLTSVYETKLTVQIMRPAPDGGAAHFTLQSVDAVLEAMEKVDAVALGPGMSHADPVADFVAALLSHIQKPVIIDADGLNVIATRKLTPPPNAVLTPHPGEMARLLETDTKTVQKDRVATVKRAAERFGCAMVLKGAHTVIAAPGEPAVVNTVSDAVLATAGSGDVLSGVIGALLAQKLRPFDAALCGVRWHGTAGAVASSQLGGTLAATDILSVLPCARENILADHDNEFWA